MRVLAVDPGIKNIGLALSDPSGTIANPLTIIIHVSRSEDAKKITDLAQQNLVGLIVVGQAVDEYGKPTFEGRKAARLAAAIREKSDLQVVLWDESFSTREAQTARHKLGSPRHKRSGHLDDLAATVILQSYLDTHHPAIPNAKK
jgi:putative Holliday junction resolvase